MTAQDLQRIVRDELAKFAGGVAEDLDEFAAEIGGDLSRAIAAGDESLTDELRAQLRALAEKHRVRLNNAAMASVQSVLNVILRTAAAVGG